jgi:hypothetical protein
MHYPHVALRQAGMQVLPVAQASSLRGGIPLHRCQVLAVTAGAQARISYNITVYTQGYRMHAGPTR